MLITKYEETLRAAEGLSREEQLQLIQTLTEHVTNDRSPVTSIMDLCGLGQELWRSQDAQKYVDDERSSWNR